MPSEYLMSVAGEGARDTPICRFDGENRASRGNWDAVCKILEGEEFKKLTSNVVTGL